MRYLGQVITVRQGSYVDEWASLLDERVPEESSEETDRADRFDWNDGRRRSGEDGRGR